MKLTFKTNTEAREFLEQRGYYLANPQSLEYAKGPVGKIGTKYCHMVRTYPGAIVYGEIEDNAE